MNTKTYQYLLCTFACTLTLVLTGLFTSVYWQHEAVVHHGARFEANSWGLVSFHWCDESAQIVLVDPAADSLTPPKLSK
jgi:hypothetical protein